jgi:uncharacterized UBP type Zn finger protein
MSGQSIHYLTSTEAAQVLGVSRRTLARYKATNKITPIRVNNKDMYSTDDLARFNADAESKLDQLTKQHMFNSARIVELEARLALLESMLSVSSTKELLNIGDVDVESLHNTLYFLCREPLERWTVSRAEDLARDVARMSDRLIRKLGEQCKVALELGYLCSSSSDDVRAPIAAAFTKAQLDRVTTVLG